MIIIMMIIPDLKLTYYMKHVETHLATSWVIDF